MLNRAHNFKILLNFCCVCGIWGSTFLAVKYAIVGIPPFVVTALRYLLASLVLFAISRMRGESRLEGNHLRLATISGVLLSIGNALVCYSAVSLPTGLVAVVIGSLPAWIVLLDCLFFGGKAPLWTQLAGICLSLVGVGALTRSHSQHLETTSLLIWVALFSSVFVWALGTLFQRKAALGNSIFLFSAVQSVSGGLLIGVTTVWDHSLFFAWDQIPASAVLAVLYLALAGTVAAATSYVWLNQNADPRLVSTYALITPVVAVWLGWLFAGETITKATLANSLMVIAGVALIAFSGMARRIRTDRRRKLVVLADLVVAPSRPQSELSRTSWREVSHTAD